MIVHQLLSGAGPVDAVTNQARAYRGLFTEWGWGGSDYAAAVDPRVERAFSPVHRCHPAPSDVLLLHYSAYAPALERFLAHPGPKVLVSHNITPGHWFWDFEPVTAVQCTIGREQLPRFASTADLCIGVSAYNARELSGAGGARTAVVPILFDSSGLGAAARDAGTGAQDVLFVGRLVPHKRHDLLLRAVALLRAEHGIEARIRFVGSPLSEPFEASLRALAERLLPADAFSMESFLPAEALAARWRAAGAFLCLSEHEGFCIPLLEAFHFGVPVIARAQGGVPEVVGDAGLLLAEDDDLPVAAEALAMVLTDSDLAAELRRRGRARLSDFSFARTADALRRELEGVAVSRGGSR